MGKSYGQMLREKGISYLSKGLTKDKVVIGRDEDGARTKSTTDELGNTVVEHNNAKDQVDVHIVAPQVRLESKEVRGA
jgi:cellobiose-specific phosphotransferase system component IIB